MNRALLDRIQDTSTTPAGIHGPRHWTQVAAAGLTLLDWSDADPEVVLLFSMLHDSMRRSNGYDPEHGDRASELALELFREDTLPVSASQLETLTKALRDHDRGFVSEDPTVGTCWDADRLNLWRVRMAPRPRLMSTRGGKSLTDAKDSRRYSQFGFDWDALFRVYADRADRDFTYLRFGDLPEGGLSWTYVPGIRENGVSAYWAQKHSEDHYTLRLDRSITGLETRYARWLLSRGRPLYELSGRLCGVGGVGDPILREAHKVRELPPTIRLDISPQIEQLDLAVRYWREKRQGKTPAFSVDVVTPLVNERALSPSMWGVREQKPPTVQSNADWLVEQWRKWGWHKLADQRESGLQRVAHAQRESGMGTEPRMPDAPRGFLE